jgi:hypothetical protein
MNHQDEVDRDPLAAREDEEGSAREENSEEEEFGLSNRTEEDYDYYQLDRLLELRQRDELTILDPKPAFLRPLTSVSASLEKEAFRHRLEEFLKEGERDVSALSPEIIDFLFDMAVDAHRHVAVWQNSIESVSSGEFDTGYGYVCQELNRYTEIRGLLTEKEPIAPHWASEWSECWIEAFKEIQRKIEGDLRFAKDELDLLKKLKRSGRTEIESHLLYVDKGFIRKRIANTRWERNLTLLLGAYAYAARLVPRRLRQDIGDYANMVKQRVSRISMSERKVIEALGFRIFGIPPYRPFQPPTRSTNRDG